MLTEHGLSLYIETHNKCILFDMGQTDLFLKNAKNLGINLSAVDVAIISHGHYDHGGGLKNFLEINSHAPVYIHKDAFLPHYNGNEKYIGLDLSVKNNPRLIFTSDKHEVYPGITLFSCNSNTKTNDFGSFGLTEKTDYGFIPDDFRHEQYLLIEENGKRILISGCSHKGISNIVSWFEPDVLVGGFHFSKMPLDSNLEAAAQALNSHRTKFYTCHCTGIEQYSFMKKYMSHLNYLACGDCLTL